MSRPRACVVCRMLPPERHGRFFCAQCARSYDRNLLSDSTVLGAIMWAASRSRRAARREIVKWLRVTPMARGVLLGIGSSQDIARLADAIERGEYRVSRDHK